MLLESVAADGFRNLDGKFGCRAGLNVICGENGHGKTNWLEAIHLLSTTKSFRTARLSEAIRFGASNAIVRGEVRQSDQIVRSLQVILEGNKKTLTVNGKKETVQRYLGQLHAFVFNSDELEIVRGGPEGRRKFLDNGIVSIFPPYVQTVSDYSKVLRQKNKLLQEARKNETPVEKIEATLEPWNEQVVSLSARIHKARVRFVDRINEVLERKLFDREEISIRYASSLEGKGDLDDYESLIAERLALRTQAEIYSGYALIGPHRDDLEISFDGRDLRKFGSSGQQRSALLTLLIAEVSVFYEQQGEYPLFLIDDIDAELDYRRIGKLLDFLKGKTQTFVSTSKESFVTQFGGEAEVIRIKEGRAESTA
ncbi:MAG: DNA replication and repair protein RecF [Acidobacteria bacterium]|nr:MAG: DNA replication and repair protein RecF [Acidobacteriota bacterium]REJ98313.1 MAG: DNA replication and repair protein RecF [Acidobacteriota bacterium]REK17057.1 MAG: DNA replication and repair protein RecF [Acidobacteriota bacterium]REK42967.1 MAG: DNA replication and repair protein RecF [Acidobacteriota bacterium]